MGSLSNLIVFPPIIKSVVVPSCPRHRDSCVRRSLRRNYREINTLSGSLRSLYFPPNRVLPFKIFISHSVSDGSGGDDSERRFRNLNHMRDRGGKQVPDRTSPWWNGFEGGRWNSLVSAVRQKPFQRALGVAKPFPIMLFTFLATTIVLKPSGFSGLPFLIPYPFVHTGPAGNSCLPSQWSQVVRDTSHLGVGLCIVIRAGYSHCHIRSDVISDLHIIQFDFWLVVY